MSRAVYARGDPVSLHPVERDDAEFLQRGHTHPDVRVPIGFSGPQSRAQTEEGIEKYVEDCGGEYIGVRYNMVAQEAGDPMDCHLFTITSEQFSQ